jgi:starch-binding outer membrane protein, SusD/RagB family
MIHKKIKNISAVLLTMALASGCSKEFLEVPPQGQTTEVLALTDPNAASLLVGGVYNTLYYGGFGNTTVGLLWALATDVASDDGDKGSSPGDFNTGGLGDLDNFVATPTNDIFFNNIWQGHFLGISAANKAIDVLNRSSLEATTKNRLIAEARFLRGFYYFNLVRMFGGVPKLDRVFQGSEGNSAQLNTRATAAEIYSFIIADLQFGVDNLPVKGDASTQIGRANKAAAQALLAKVYMYQKNWQQVLQLTNAIITSGQYALVSDYGTIFREKPAGGAVQGGNNNMESIFEVQTGITANEDGVSSLYSNGQGARSKGGWNDLGFGFNTPTTDLANAYEAGDTRRAGTIIFIQPTGGANTGTVLWDGYRIPTQDSVENSRYNYKVYHSPIAESAQASGNKDTKPKNIRLMRYAEVLLMYAEASAMLGSGDGVNKLNQVRARAGLGATTLSQANVWKERRVELAMENDRFFDLVRQGRAGAVLRAHGKSFVDGKHELFPIPQRQIDLSGGRLTQNPGY